MSTSTYCYVHPHPSLSILFACDDSVILLVNGRERTHNSCHSCALCNDVVAFCNEFGTPNLRTRLHYSIIEQVNHEPPPPATTVVQFEHWHWHWHNGISRAHTQYHIQQTNESPMQKTMCHPPIKRKNKIQNGWDHLSSLNMPSSNAAIKI